MCCLSSITYAQKQPMESSLLIGYQKYVQGYLNVGYSAFFEQESMYGVTRRTRLNVSALANPAWSLYGLQFGVSHSYVFSGGMNVNIIRNIPIWRSWVANFNPNIGIDIWFFSLQAGYNFNLSLQPELAPPPPPLGRWNLTANFYIPFKKNQRMYR